jgi:hypothetical protein
VRAESIRAATAEYEKIRCCPSVALGSGNGSLDPSGITRAMSPNKIGKRKKRMSELRNIGENEDPESGSAQFEFAYGTKTSVEQRSKWERHFKGILNYRADPCHYTRVMVTKTSSPLRASLTRAKA